MNQNNSFTPFNDTDDSHSTQKTTEIKRSVTRAVFLAAGKGTRLQPLTDEVPKCLIEIAGKPMIEHALQALSVHGITEAIIVIGFKGQLIRDRLGTIFNSIQIRYTEAPLYETTNNICSLWDARNSLDQDILLLEADVVFDSNLIAKLLAEQGSSAAVAPHHHPMSGTVVECNCNKKIISFYMGSHHGKELESKELFKTVNIYLLRKNLLQDQIVPRLDNVIKAGKTQDYYEIILQDCVADGSLEDLAAVDVSSTRWFENDDHRDLDLSQFLFLDRDAQFDHIQQLHGAYWRYGFTDHSYLYNMHFPPAGMLDSFKQSLPEIITNYPVAQKHLARLITDWNGANTDHVVVANGASELIKILATQVKNNLSIPTPSFNEYEEVLHADQINRFLLNPETFSLDTDAFIDSVNRNKSDMVVLVTPNNPTSVSIPQVDVLKIVQELEQKHCRVVVDESFIDFSESGVAGSIEGMATEFQNLVVIKSMSKVFGIAGLRLGYLVSADRVFVDTIKNHLPIWNINGFAEEFLRTIGRYRNEFRESCMHTRVSYLKLYEDLLKLPGLEPLKPDANFILCKLTDPSSSAAKITRQLYVKYNILVKNCSYKTMQDPDRYLRIASRTLEENQQLVANLAKIV